MDTLSGDSISLTATTTATLTSEMGVEKEGEEGNSELFPLGEVTGDERNPLSSKGAISRKGSQDTPGDDLIRAGGLSGVGSGVKVGGSSVKSEEEEEESEESDDDTMKRFKPMSYKKTK